MFLFVLFLRQSSPALNSQWRKIMLLGTYWLYLLKTFETCLRGGDVRPVSEMGKLPTFEGTEFVTFIDVSPCCLFETLREVRIAFTVKKPLEKIFLYKNNFNDFIAVLQSRSKRHTARIKSIHCFSQRMLDVWSSGSKSNGCFICSVG